MNIAITPTDRDLAERLMTPREFEAWLLVDGLGWSQYQAANHLNISRASVRDRLLKARSKWLNRATITPVRHGRRTNEIPVNLLIQRDGPWCYLCGIHASTTKLEVEHVIPTSHGGNNDATNLRLACSQCNLRKGTQSVALLVNSRRPVYYPIV